MKVMSEVREERKIGVKGRFTSAMTAKTYSLSR